MIDGAGDDAGDRIDAQARRQAGGAERQLVAGIRVREPVRNVIADFRLGIDAGLVGKRGRNGTVVGAGDRHDHGRGGRRAAGVRDGVRNGAGGGFAHGQVIVLATRREHIAAVGLDDKGAARGAKHADAVGRHRTAADRGDRKRIAVGVRVIDEQIAADQGALVAAARIVQRVRRIVDRDGRDRGRSDRGRRDGRRAGGVAIVGAVARQGRARDAGQGHVAARRVRVGQVQRAGAFKDAGQADKAAAAGLAAAGHDGGGGVQVFEGVTAGLQRGQQAIGVRTGGGSDRGFRRIRQRAGHVAIHRDFTAFADDDRHAVFNLKRNRGARGGDHVAASGDFAALMQFGQGAVAIAYPRATGDFVDDCG
ncbi:hypothetical protein D3C86_1140690 [compost metagenome]